MSVRSTCLTAGALLALAPPWSADAAGIEADQLTLFATVASDYVLRGYSQTNAKPVAQVGVDFEHPGGLFAGVRLSSVEFPPRGPFEDARDLEVNLYAGYGLEIGGEWAVSTSLVHYEYPGAEDPIDWDYTELGLALQRGAAALSIAYSNRAFGSDDPGVAIDVSGRWALGAHLELTAGLGFFDLESRFLMDYLYWSAEISRPWRRFNFTLGYFDTDDRGRELWGDLAGARGIAGATYRIH